LNVIYLWLNGGGNKKNHENLIGVREGKKGGKEFSSGGF
jgi:hypothetical protein